MNTGQVTGRNPTSPPSQIIAFRKVPLIAASIFLVAAIAFLPVAGAGAGAETLVLTGDLALAGSGTTVIRMPGAR
jgi:hypothetical protein